MILAITLMSILIVLLGGILAATPWLMPPTECFAVTVPPSAQKDPRIKGYRFSFALRVGAISLACAAGMALALPHFMGTSPMPDKAALVTSSVITAATLAPVAAGFALMLHYRSRVQELKKAEGWTASAQRAAALISEQVPQPISLAWNLLHVALALALIIFALAMYDHFPSKIPMNIDFSVITYADKSVGVVLFPAILVGYMGLIYTMCHWFIIVSKRPIDPAAPATSALAYGRFARIQSQLMLVGGLLISISVAGTFYLTALGLVSLMASTIILMLVVILFVAAMMAASVKLGQSGARLAAELHPANSLARDDDTHWYLGTFYFNPDDPSIIVPKRFGFGWTINHARPAAWVLIAAILALTLIFILLMLKITG